MYELVHASNNTYYIESPAKIGVVVDGADAVIIDSGNDKDAGKKIKKILDANGWNLRAILNTHSHADHIGGNRYLQPQTGCKIYAPEIECDFTNHPILEPALLYGANPPAELLHKFLLAQESRALPLTADALPNGMEIIPLAGHTFNMVGFRTADDVVFLADCLSSEKTLEKYQIGFIYDIAAYLNTLEMVKTMSATLFVPSHAEPTANIVALAQKNIDKVHEIADVITQICTEPKPFEQLLANIFTHYNLTMTFEQHALVGSTVKSYLTWLKGNNTVTCEIDNNTLLWRTL